MRLHSLAPALLIFAATAACGPSKPARTSDTDSLASTTSSSSPAKGSGPTAPPGDEPAPSAEVDQGIKSFESGDYAAAQTSFEAAVKKNPKNYIALSNLGLTLEKAGKPAEAEKAYKRALEIRPDLVQAASGITEIWITSDPPKLDEAIALCRAVLKKHPDAAAIHHTLAIALAKKGDQEASIKEFDEAIRLNPADPMFHITFAQYYTAWKVKGAVAHLDMAKDLAKDDVGLLAAIGHEYRAAGAFTECVALYDKLIAKKDSGELRTERALCKRGLKDDAGALSDLQAAVKNDPTFAPAHVYLGMRYVAASKYKEAITEYEAYLKLTPNTPQARDVEQKLKDAREKLKKQ